MRILIVDDDEDIRDAMSETLQLEGHRTDCAADGLEALDILRRRGASTCLILLDLKMPGMDGSRFREELNKDERLSSIPVVLVTAAGDAAEKASTLRAAGFLRKPIRGAELLELVGRFCVKT